MGIWRRQEQKPNTFTLKQFFGDLQGGAQNPQGGGGGQMPPPPLKKTLPILPLPPPPPPLIPHMRISSLFQKAPWPHLSLYGPTSHSMAPPLTPWPHLSLHGPTPHSSPTQHVLGGGQADMLTCHMELFPHWTCPLLCCVVSTSCQTSVQPLPVAPFSWVPSNP